MNYKETENLILFSFFVKKNHKSYKLLQALNINTKLQPLQYVLELL